jgi:glycosyltransferase involved in cell wall biosynthesis
LTIKASGKIAAYLKSGLPILTRNFEGMRDFYRRTGCGESFDSFDRIGELLSIIDNDYDRYQENAYRTFREDYSTERYLNYILDYLIDQKIIPAS